MGCNSSHFTRISEHNCRPGISIQTVHVNYNDEGDDDEQREETSQNDNTKEDILNNREVYSGSLDFLKC